MSFDIYSAMSLQNSLAVMEQQTMIPQAQYAKKLRPFLPAEAFDPNPNTVSILLINVAIFILGWGMASYLDRWYLYLLPLYLPFVLIMANSVIVLAFSSHDLMHSASIKNRYLMRIISILGLTIVWMPPTFWKALHNRQHHNKTNSLADPDRNYLYPQPNNWGKWSQNLLLPSSEVHPFWLMVGMTSVWGLYTFRHLTSILFFNSTSVDYIPAAFTVTNKERRAIAFEVMIMAAIHLSVLAYLQFHPLKILLGYFLPIWIGYSGLIFYIYTNHLALRMTSINDPLINSLSIRVPKIFDLLHLNFSYHTEHHIFPGINSDYYPQVQELLQIHYPGRLNLLDAGAAWRLLMKTPRHYKDENILTDWNGEKSVTCPLSQELKP